MSVSDILCKTTSDPVRFTGMCAAHTPPHTAAHQPLWFIIDFFVQCLCILSFEVIIDFLCMYACDLYRDMLTI